MSKNKYSSHLELAHLVRANISAPTKYKLIQKAQERLVQSLEAAGAVSAKEADELLI
ncbi:hypothetical protein ACFL1M_01375 [Patescibacteria group bacterium]